MENTSENTTIEIGPEIINTLNATWKWTMFLSVLGFIFLGLLIVAGLVTSTFLSSFKTEEVSLGIPESLLFIVWIIIATISFFPVFFLIRFSRHTRNAVHTHDKQELHKAFKNLRIYFTYIGIMVIVVVTIYIVALIAAGASMSFLKGM